MGKPPAKRHSDPPSTPDGPGAIRIIGGRLRGSTIPYDGDPRVRPMKDRVREAVFNLLAVQPVGAHVIDLFAGTGAMAIEAMSRGARDATLFERHFPTARRIQDTLARLELAGACQVHFGDAFFWVRRLLAPDAAADGLPGVDAPWLVFCCPPYQLYIERRKDLVAMVGELIQRAPPGSRLVVESDERFDPAELPRAEQWVVRQYPPAVIALLAIAGDGP